MKKTIIIITIIILIIILLIAGFILINNSITGKVIEEQNNNKIYSHTKAICNSTNYCQDTEIVCRGNEIISTKPITGAAVQFDENWQDPRAEEERERLC